MRKKDDVISRIKADPNEKNINDAVKEIAALRRKLALYEGTARLVRIRKASDADCAVASDCYSAIVSNESKRKWLADHDLFVADGRAFALVDTEKHVYFMDAVTGSLYNFGECLTSTATRTGFVRDRKKAEEILSRLHKMKIDCTEEVDEQYD